MKSKKFIQWFFVIASFVFLYWYMPVVVSDNKVTPFEMSIIGMNILSMLVNLTARLAK